MSERILLIEDDVDAVEMLESALGEEGYDCIAAQTGQEGLAKERTQSPHLVVIDLLLPDMDGYGVCRQLRQRSTVPIIMITGRDELIDRVVGLEVGADDYVAKPLRPQEFVARVQAQLRRTTEYARPRQKNNVLDFGELKIDHDRHEVIVRGEPTHLTRKEFELLSLLAENEGRVMRSQDLLKQIWDYDESIKSRTLDVHIGRVRAKIEREPSSPETIITVPCLGYKFVRPRQAT
jgi:two-component system response regulator RegX3